MGPNPFGCGDGQLSRLLNNLARSDRGMIDEQDAKSVLIRQKHKLNERHLRKRALEAGVLAVLQNIQAQ